MKRPMLILLILLLAGAAVCGWLQQTDFAADVPASITESAPLQTPPVTVTPTDMVEAVG